VIRRAGWLLIAALAAGLVACGRNSGAPDTATSAPAASPSAAAQPDAAAATEPGADRGDVSLERITALPESAQLPGGRWKAGVNYQPVVPAQSTSAPPGQVEVLEVFWYGCGHCYALDPFLERWRQQKPANIKFVRVPVIWGQGPHRAHARFFYTLEALGKLDALHSATFDAVQKGSNPLVDADEAKTFQLQLAFAKSHGIAEADFTREYNGFYVNSALQRADDITRRYNVDSVPRIIVNGKYQTDVGMAGGHEQLIALINDLAAAEKKR
jgi:protein dithiol oxidoreductase (disulfide-forming)